MSPYTEAQAKKMADSALKELEKYADNGIPKVYNNMDEVMVDWWADLPWNMEASRVSILHLLESTDTTRVGTKLRVKYGFELREHLIEGLTWTYPDKVIRGNKNE